MTESRPRVRLGPSDIEVTPVGLGCWQFSGGRGLAGSFWPALDQDSITEIVSEAVTAGINWFDTAEGYGWGHSERSLDRALRDPRASAGSPIIATKWWPILRRAGHIRSSIEERREALGGRVIDLYQIHQRIPLSSLRRQMSALADVVEAGHVRTVGVSNFSARAMREAARLLGARGVPLVSNQVRYSLLDRGIEGNGVLEAAQALGVSIIAYSPLAQGILSGRFHETGSDPAEQVSGPRRRMPAFRAHRLRSAAPVVAALRGIAGKHDCTPAQVALAWVTRPREAGTVLAIPGATTPRQAEQNGSSMRIDLTAEEIQRLNHISDPNGS